MEWSSVSSKARAARRAPSMRSPIPIFQKKIDGRTGAEAEWFAAKRERKRRVEDPPCEALSQSSKRRLMEEQTCLAAKSGRGRVVEL